jgi:hypothetical protein
MSIQALKQAVADSKGDFEDGTVIRWRASDRFAYAVIKTPVGWFSTARPGNGFIPSSPMTFPELVEVIGRAETSDVEVATAWTPIADMPDE